MHFFTFPSKFIIFNGYSYLGSRIILKGDRVQLKVLHQIVTSHEPKVLVRIGHLLDELADVVRAHSEHSKK